jgi:hypothetical protein
MADITGDSKMSPFQRKLSLIMFCNAEFDRNKSLFRVASLAIFLGLSITELSLVVVLMTIPALGKVINFQRLVGEMTFLAGDHPVFANQRESSFRMIKVNRIIVPPTGWIMTGLAILPEFVFVNICVAICTIVMDYTVKF